MTRLDEFPLWFLRLFALLLGLVWGSFLNVVIYRSPRGLSVVRPASHCPACGAPVKPYDNVPVLAFLWLRGRARCCGAALSLRYPLVELLGGVLSLAVVEHLVATLGGEGSPVRFVAWYVAEFTLVMGLVAAAFIDAEHMYLPDLVTMGGTVLGLATATIRGLPLVDAALGAFTGFVLVWLPFLVIYEKLRGRPGMGLGDAKLLMLAGAWFGPLGALFVLLAGAVQGSVTALGILAVHGKIEEPAAVKEDRLELRAAAEAGDVEAAEILASDPLASPEGEGFGQARLPFGPFLILGCLEWLFFGIQVRLAWRSWMGL